MLRQGDLVVGVDGTNVMGICSITKNGLDSYQYQDSFNYAQTSSYPVEWIDWKQCSQYSPDFTLRTSKKGFIGAPHIRKKKEEVINAWKAYQKRVNQ